MFTRLLHYKCSVIDIEIIDVICVSKLLTRSSFEILSKNNKLSISYSEGPNKGCFSFGLGDHLSMGTK